MTLRSPRILAWCLASAFLAVVAGTSWAQDKIPGAAPYLEGLDALEEGRWPEAVNAFSRALEVSGDDATFVLARGVANVLAEQFPQGLKDLERAQRLGLRGREVVVSGVRAILSSISDNSDALDKAT